MQHSWQFHYFSTLINLGTDNMFRLVCLHWLFFFPFYTVFLCLQLVFFRIFVRVTKAWQERARSERGYPGLFCLQNMLLGNSSIVILLLWMWSLKHSN